MQTSDLPQIPDMFLCSFLERTARPEHPTCCRMLRRFCDDPVRPDPIWKLSICPRQEERQQPAWMGEEASRSGSVERPFFHIDLQTNVQQTIILRVESPMALPAAFWGMWPLKARIPLDCNPQRCRLSVRTTRVTEP